METSNMNQPLEEGIWDAKQNQGDYANFWVRFAAALIDGIVLNIFFYLLMFTGVAGLFFSTDGFDEEALAMADPETLLSAYLGFIALSIIINWLYFALMESSRYQGTLGKMAVKIKVTDYNGERISFGRATGRHFGKMISGLILMIGYIMAGFTEKKQALHDMMASTFVIQN